MCQCDAKNPAQPDSWRRQRGRCAPRARGRTARALAATALGLLLATCESPPEEGSEPSSAAPAGAAPDPAAFSGARAFEHLERIAGFGPRITGTRGADLARRYLAERLAEVGAAVQEVRVTLPGDGRPDGVEAVHVLGVLPGRSPDRLLLAAAYDTRPISGVEFVGANASASGPALLLELARVLSLRDRPYTIEIAFLDGDRLPALRPGGSFPGTRAFAKWLQARSPDGFDRIRLAVLFEQVADMDLTIARELRSHHVYREFFWEAAGVLGKGAYFPPDANVESVEASHLELIEAGLPRTVLIADPRFGGSEVPGRYAGTDKDTPVRCSPYSLEVVGAVGLEALDRIVTRLARIDRFRQSPLEDPLGAELAPGPAPDADRDRPLAE